MLIIEQESLQERYYSGVVRYMDNANECLKKARKDDNYYNDQKYVRMTCGLNSAYKILHLCGYCDEIENTKVIKKDFKESYKIIKKFKPTA